MRERMARIYAVVIGIAFVLLAALFAERQNGAQAAARAAAMEARTAAPVVLVPPPDVPPNPAEVARGREVYDEQGCARCHRVQGEGNPRSPLDGVGGRLTPEQLRDYVVAGEGVRASLSPSVARAKFAFSSLPGGDLDALVTYLATLRDE